MIVLFDVEALVEELLLLLAVEPLVAQALANENRQIGNLAARLLTQGKRQGPARGAALPELTEREGQILAEVARGLTNKEIARALSLSEKTVKHHMTNVMQKLQVRNRVEAAMVYRKQTQGR